MRKKSILVLILLGLHLPEGSSMREHPSLCRVVPFLAALAAPLDLETREIFAARRLPLSSAEPSAASSWSWFCLFCEWWPESGFVLCPVGLLSWKMHV